MTPSSPPPAASLPPFSSSPTGLPPISAEALAYLRAGDPVLLRRLEQAAQRSLPTSRRRSVRVPLARFGGDFLLAYVAAWYGVSQGLAITFTPEADRRA